ncbi:hypothetical protein D3C81_1808050 [compost metagenome]
MFYAFLHAQGRAKLTAIFHVIELPLFVGMLYWLVQGYGVIGAAVAWLFRVSIDTLLLGGAVYRLRRVEGITHAVK